MIGSFLLPLFMVFNLAALIIGSLVFVVMLLRRQKRLAREAGFPSMGAYLRAAPRTDQEKREAIDLALKGLALCLLGLIFSPLLLIGLFPFFYGVRKMVYASQGLGLTDDSRA